MSKLEKQMKRLLSLPNDYTYNECKTFLQALGYQVHEGSGSSVKFFRDVDEDKISFHKPHHTNELKHYILRQIIEHLTNNGDI